MTTADEGLRIASLDLEGRGIAHNAAGKVVFVSGALPGETVQVQINRSKASFDTATLTSLQRESPLRVKPSCEYFRYCGGCAMQHLHMSGQVAAKQRVLEDNLWHLGRVKPEGLLRPIEGPSWAYRYRARLSVRFVRKKGRALVGFRERTSPYVADMGHCPVLPTHVSDLLRPLAQMIEGLSVREQIPQIEVSVGESVTALVLRHLQPLTEADAQVLRAFVRTQAELHPDAPALVWWLQPKGPETVAELDAVSPDAGLAQTLHYSLPEFGVVMPYRPTDFTQVNFPINRVLVSRALRLLDVQPQERAVDWFCGLGNFTLPLARQAQQVLGLEGSAPLVKRAQSNAQFNGLGNVKFALQNLFEVTPADLLRIGSAEKWLIDPPREGAYALVQALQAVHDQPECAPGFIAPQRMVYVSCNPATLARDAGILEQAGYSCRAAGVVNMFPHTAHVESMAVFERR